ncbi:hypothetical protein [Streptomyces sp. NPDC020141]|uniref:hypothetical protein n=1 Tax=Streptomyces sp. NPDC020141 TaxID=3365065 RepID=UPI003798DCF9
MNTRWKRCLAAAGLAAALAVPAAGCSDGEGGPSDVASRAIASATAAVDDKLHEIKGGVNAKDQVTLGAPDRDADGRTTVEVTARNTAGSPKSFAVQIIYRDPGGNLLDTVLVTLPDIPAGSSAKATARSNRDLSGDVRAETGTALRY